MRGHDHDHEGDAGFRPKGDRPQAPGDDLMFKAAAAGRTDVLGPAGMLGLQRAVGNAGVGAVVDEERSPVHDVISSGGGSPLDADTRADMEARMGSDFSDVRVHTDGKAHESARSVNAQAYTVGSNIVFQRDRYDPGSEGGRHMLAHELTHVVQQRSGPVDGTDAGGGVKVSDPGDRFERAAVDNASRVLATPSSTAGVQRCAEDHDHGSHAAAPAADTAAPAPVQRAEAGEEEREDETAQTFVQRQEDEEEEAPAE
jgi:hypothetical protein